MTYLFLNARPVVLKKQATKNDSIERDISKDFNIEMASPNKNTRAQESLKTIIPKTLD